MVCIEVCKQKIFIETPYLFNNMNMQNEIQPKIYLIADENDTSKVYDISSKTRIYLDIQDISQI